MFLRTHAIDIRNGITDNDWEVVQLKKAMIETGNKVVSLSISEINTTQRIKVCDAGDINVLITELDPGNELFQPYLEQGIEVL